MRSAVVLLALACAGTSAHARAAANLAPPPTRSKPDAKPHVVTPTGRLVWYARYPIWVTASSLTLGAVCAWRFRVARDQFDGYKADGMHGYSELQAIEARGKSWALAANLSFGFALLGGLMLVTGADQPRSVVVVASPSNIGLAVRF